jgi:hypothetical protein
MLAILNSLGMSIVALFKPRCRLEAENLFLRHQLSIALRHAPPRPRLRGSDRALLVRMTQLWPSLLGAARVVQPDTILRWHRAGSRRSGAGNPAIGQGGVCPAWPLTIEHETAGSYEVLWPSPFGRLAWNLPPTTT